MKDLIINSKYSLCVSKPRLACKLININAQFNTACKVHRKHTSIFITTEHNKFTTGHIQKTLNGNTSLKLMKP
jgi:hypothetical protein